MADVAVSEVPVPAAAQSVQRSWTVQFLNDTAITVEADEFRMDPSAQTVELQLGGEVVLTAPRANVLYVQRIEPS